MSNGKKSGFDFVKIPIGRGEPHVSDEGGIITAEWDGETLHFHYLYNPGTDREASALRTGRCQPTGRNSGTRNGSRDLAGKNSGAPLCSTNSHKSQSDK